MSTPPISSQSSLAAYAASTSANSLSQGSEVESTSTSGARTRKPSITDEGATVTTTNVTFNVNDLAPEAFMRMLSNTINTSGQGNRNVVVTLEGNEGKNNKTINFFRPQTPKPE